MAYQAQSRCTILFLILCVSLVTQDLSAQWQQVGLTNKRVYSLWAKGDTVIAGALRGETFRSSDGGKSWSIGPTLSPVNNIVYTLASRDSVVFAGISWGTPFGDPCPGCGGVYVSSDYGVTWRSYGEGLPDQIGVGFFFFRDTVLYLSSDYGIFHREFQDTSWHLFDDYLLRKEGIECGLLVDSTIYAGTMGSGVFTRTLRDPSWQPANLGLPKSPFDTMYYIYISPLYAFSNMIYAGVDSQVFVTSRDSIFWKPIEGNIGPSYVAAFASKETTLFVATGEKVFFKYPNDVSWRVFSTGLVIPSSHTMIVADNSLFLGTSIGVWKRSLSDVVSVNDEPEHTVPHNILLAQNYPNPFNPETAIEFVVVQRTHVRILVKDLLGRTIRTLTEGEYAEGKHKVVWDGKGEQNHPVASGVYFYRLESGSTVVVKRMILLR